MDKKFTPYLKPNEVLSDEQIVHLREKSDLKGIGLLTHAWMIILLAVSIFSIFPNFRTFIFFQTVKLSNFQALNIVKVSNLKA